MSGPAEELRFRSATVLGTWLIRALFATVRIEREGTGHFRRFRSAGRPVIFVFWHDQLLPLTYVHRNEGAVVLVSEHADGEYIARILERLGFGTARGSSTRGGSRGLRTLLRAARSGRDLGITPDGPRGPRHRAKEGALVAAQLAGLPVVPVGVAASASWRFDSWDRFMVPRPFSTVRVVYGSPRQVPRGIDRDDRRELARELSRTLEALTARAAHGHDGDGDSGAEPAGATRPGAAATGPGSRREREDRASAP